MTPAPDEALIERLRDALENEAKWRLDRSYRTGGQNALVEAVAAAVCQSFARALSHIGETGR